MKEVKDGSENCSPVIAKYGSADLGKGCALKVFPSTLLTNNYQLSDQVGSVITVRNGRREGHNISIVFLNKNKNLKLAF